MARIVISAPHGIMEQALQVIEPQVISTLPQPQGPVRINAEQEKERQLAVARLRKIGIVGMGAHGEPRSFIETVPNRLLWVSQFAVKRYSEKDIKDMAMSLQQTGEMTHAIKVVYAIDPSCAPDDPDPRCFMIVDGVKRHEGAKKAGPDFFDVPVEIKPYTTIVDAVCEAVKSKTEFTPLTQLEIGRGIVSIRYSYEMEKRMYEERGMRYPMPEFYTQEELQRILGFSQPTISTWCKLATQPIEFLKLVDRGEITQGQAIQILRLPEEKRVDRARLIADRNRERQQKASDIAAAISAERHPLYPFLTEIAPEAPDELMSIINKMKGYLERVFAYRGNKRIPPVFNQLARVLDHPSFGTLELTLEAIKTMPEDMDEDENYIDGTITTVVDGE